MRLIKVTSAKNGDTIKIRPEAIDGICPAIIPEESEIKVPKGKRYSEIFMRGITIIVRESIDEIEKRVYRLDTPQIESPKTKKTGKAKP